MPTVEDYFDDDTDLPLPSSSTSYSKLPNTGHHGALLEEISTDDPDEAEIDLSLLADQGRGVFGEGSRGAPPPDVSGKGKMTARPDPGGVRPSTGPGQGQGVNPNTPMGGFMGDMMRMQQAEDDRMEKLRKQFGNASVAADPSVFKMWNTVYPIYFDAKVSVNDGRRVPRRSAIWWPQAQYISLACRVLGLQCVLEPDRCHPADWENPGRVKVLFEKDGRFFNPIIKNRTQLYKHLADQLRQQHPKLVYTKSTTRSKPKSSTATTTTPSKPKLATKPSKTNTTAVKSRKTRAPPRSPSRPPAPPFPVPKLDDRLPLHSPVHPTGVAVSSVKRDLESEKEAKKKGIGAPGLGGDGEDLVKGKEKTPKMKRIMVRKR